jgi:hypothetical protein
MELDALSLESKSFRPCGFSLRMSKRAMEPFREPV